MGKREVNLEHRLTQIETEITWIKWIATGGLTTGVITVLDLARIHFIGG